MSALPLVAAAAAVVLGLVLARSVLVLSIRHLLADTTPQTYELGRWYVSGKGVRFILFEFPQRCVGREGYWVGPALMKGGRVENFMWGPATRPLAPWPVRVLAPLFRAPRVHPVPARYEAIVGSPWPMGFPMDPTPPATSADTSKGHTS
jgi:hypothetical protein